MKIALGEKGLRQSWQAPFHKSTSCAHCACSARIAFVAHEGMDDDDRPVYPRDFVQFVTDLHNNGGEGDYWPHDCCAVAVYFCTNCLEATALFNQA